MTVPPTVPAAPQRPGYPARRRLRGQGPDRHRQAGRAGGASGGRQSRRHPGQCPDRPLRRELIGIGGEAGPASSTAWTRTHRACWSPPRPSAPWQAWPSNSPITPSSAPITPWCGAARALGNGVIEGQIGRSPFDRKRMAVLRGGGKTGAHALSRDRRNSARRNGRSPRLIECRLETGRTHQIRVHLTHLGHPLIGDPQYGRAAPAARGQRSRGGSARVCAAAEFPRQALHAFMLGISAS